MHRQQHSSDGASTNVMFALCCRVRWGVCARPRLSLSAEDAPQSTEVISTYTFDSHGKIYEHVVDQIIPPESLPVCRVSTQQCVHEPEPRSGSMGILWRIHMLNGVCCDSQLMHVEIYFRR